MRETPKQYTKRILNYQQGKDPVSILWSTPGKVAALLRGHSRKRLATRPGLGKWSVAEILAHLADAELVTGFRMRLILGANRTPIQAFDQDAWADFSRYGKQDPYLSLEAFRVQRERNVRLLKSLPKRMWGHYGLHSERGKETIKRVVKMTAGHDINHLKQVERIARGKGG
jgi:hypothetical protein